MPVDLGIDCVELYVADVRAKATVYIDRYGFTLAGTCGAPDQGFRSIALTQGNIILVLTEGISEEHPATAYVLAHGDGVADIALRTDDARAAFAEAVRLGARPVTRPHVRAGRRPVITATVATFGDITHTFVQRDAADTFGLLPGFLPSPGQPSRLPADTPANDAVGLLTIDHFAVCVNAGELDPTVEFYQRVLGFRLTFTERITVGTQAMNSKVVRSRSGTVTLTILEPDASATPGQIDAFLKNHGGAGIQHVAFETDDAVRTVRSLAARGVEFLPAPGAYYDALSRRLTLDAHTPAELRELSILIDEDHNGQLFQIFTRSTHERRTLFFEVIERLGAESFGTSNIRALYEAVELERTREHGQRC